MSHNLSNCFCSLQSHGFLNFFKHQNNVLFVLDEKYVLRFIPLSKMKIKRMNHNMTKYFAFCFGELFHCFHHNTFKN